MEAHMRNERVLVYISVLKIKTSTWSRRSVHDDAELTLVTASNKKIMSLIRLSRLPVYVETKIWPR